MPTLVSKLAENKMMYSVAIFFVASNIQAMLLQTGAFEVSIDGTVVFSKLETGQMADLGHLIHIF